MAAIVPGLYGHLSLSPAQCDGRRGSTEPSSDRGGLRLLSVELALEVVYLEMELFDDVMILGDVVVHIYNILTSLKETEKKH